MGINDSNRTFPDRHMVNDDNVLMRILLITSDKFPLFRPAVTAIFGSEMARQGHVVDCVLQAETERVKPESVPYGNGTLFIGATDDGETRFRRLRKYLLDVLNDLRVIRLVRENDYDIVQVKDRYFSALLGLVIARLIRKPFCYWLAYPHAEGYLYAAEQGIARYPIGYLIKGYFYWVLLYKLILPNADHIFVQSEQMKKDLHQHGIPMDKMTPIPGSLDLAAYPYERAPQFTPKWVSDDEKRILYLGTLGRERQLTFLIRVLERVRRVEPTARLYLLGKGVMPEDEQELQDEVARLALEGAVVFMGFLPMSEALEYVRGADVCVSPYYPTPILNSTSPTKLIEYMAMARPVVGNDHPEQSLVINESRSGVVTAWEEDDFAEGIIKVLGDPAEAHHMGLRGRRYVETHRTNAVLAAVVMEQYRKIIEGRRHV